MVNHLFNEYQFNEGTSFEGLMPKTMELLGKENCVGVTESEPIVSMFDITPEGADQMEVVSVSDIMADKEDEE